jgi:transcriptional regulator with XRE-family HTH domain
MYQNQKQHQNRLDIYRRRMGFTPSFVARLLGHQDASTVSDYERGERLPSLVNAFRLGIILRVPVEFLFPSLYDELRQGIRAEEERIAQPSPSQQVLF